MITEVESLKMQLFQMENKLEESQADLAHQIRISEERHKMILELEKQLQNAGSV